MAEGRFDETFVANNDLDDYQYHILVNSTGNLVDRAVSAGALCCGVLQNKPKSGEHATVRMLGRSRIKAGGTITAGNAFTTTASATATAAGSGQYILGIAITGVASGGIFQGLITHAGYKG